MAGAAAWRPPAAPKPDTNVGDNPDYHGDVNPSSGGGKPAMPDYSQDAAAKKKRQLMPVDPALKQVQSLLATIPKLKELLGPYGADGRMGKYTRDAITTYLQYHPDDAAEPAFKTILDKYKIPVPPRPGEPQTGPSGATPEKKPGEPQTGPSGATRPRPPVGSIPAAPAEVKPRPTDPLQAQVWDSKYARAYDPATGKKLSAESIELADLIRLVEKLK
jgi:hypothetical protein